MLILLLICTDCDCVMEFPCAPFDYDAAQPLPPLSSPIRVTPLTSNETVKEYDPEDTWGEWPKLLPGQIRS